mgnify:CR=1 FL=1
MCLTMRLEINFASLGNFLSLSEKKLCHKILERHLKVFAFSLTILGCANLIIIYFIIIFTIPHIMLPSMNIPKLAKPRSSY